MIVPERKIYSRFRWTVFVRQTVLQSVMMCSNPGGNLVPSWI